jgi:hypothetical protein
MKDELSIERTIGRDGLGLVAPGYIAILWPFATSLLWAIIIVFPTCHCPSVWKLRCTAA